ncbi:MAG: hypothetical protein GF317_23010 [Candidatus Lokiarchaeota archaeon]|nr:hypothetical protein [Candidatus Lokiarchaeota archaeon]MBD3202314.1 hypothetical protein [Candidatus Lokiarchaeota archaeon]
MNENEYDNASIEFISTSGVYKTPFTIIIIIEIFLASLIISLVNLWFVNSLYYLLTGTQFYPFNTFVHWSYWLLLPLNIYVNIFFFLGLIMIISWVIYKILKILHPPREGIFDKGSKDWKYMHRRFWTAYFPIWLARAIPFPWSDIIVYRLFGTNIGNSVVAYEGYIDPEFVEIGKNTMTSLHICIFSHLIYHDKVIIKRVKIERNCVIGPQTLTSPGTIIHEGGILGANSYTSINQELEGNLIHVGTPVNVNFPIQSLDESRKKVEKIKSK